MHANRNTGSIALFISKAFAWAVFGLFVLVDGLRNPETFDTQLLTLPYLVGGLAFVLSIPYAMSNGYPLHAALFWMGLFTLAALA